MKKYIMLILLFSSLQLFGAPSKTAQIPMKATVLDTTQVALSIIPIDFAKTIYSGETGVLYGANTTIMEYDFGSYNPSTGSGGIVKGESKRSLTGRFLVTLTRGEQKVAFTNPPIATLQKGTIEANKIESEGKNASGDFVIPIEYDLVDFQKQATGEYIGRVKVTVDPEDSRVITGKFVDSTVGIKASVSGQMM